jgi:hypothetical protein
MQHSRGQGCAVEAARVTLDFARNALDLAWIPALTRLRADSAGRGRLEFTPQEPEGSSAGSPMHAHVAVGRPHAILLQPIGAC